MALMSAPNASMQQSGSNDSALIQWHTGIVRWTALWSNGIQASPDWQCSDPMAYKHRQIDSTLAQWCWGHSGAAVIFLGDRATLVTTQLKCSASTCAHWRTRPPPSSPMPRNGTASKTSLQKPHIRTFILRSIIRFCSFVACSLFLLTITKLLPLTKLYLNSVK